MSETPDSDPLQPGPSSEETSKSPAEVPAKALSIEGQGSGATEPPAAGASEDAPERPAATPAPGGKLHSVRVPPTPEGEGATPVGGEKATAPAVEKTPAPAVERAEAAEGEKAPAPAAEKAAPAAPARTAAPKPPGADAARRAGAGSSSRLAKGAEAEQGPLVGSADLGWWVLNATMTVGLIALTAIALYSCARMASALFSIF